MVPSQPIRHLLLAAPPAGQDGMDVTYTPNAGVIRQVIEYDMADFSEPLPRHHRCLHKATTCLYRDCSGDDKRSLKKRRTAVNRRIADSPHKNADECLDAEKTDTDAAQQAIQEYTQAIKMVRENPGIGNERIETYEEKRDFARELKRRAERS